MARALTLSGRPATSVPEASLRTQRARGAAWRWGLLLAAGWLVQAGLRAWLSHSQTVPLANPDETAYLIAARVLAGGQAVNLSGSTLYQAGYPLLITPVFWFTRNPVTAYRAVLIVNAAVSALVMPLGYLVCRRLKLGRRAAFGVGMAGALLPAGLFYSEFAMADAIFPVVMLAWLLATHSWLTAVTTRGRYLAAAGSALLAGYAYSVHSRGLVMLAGYAAVGALLAWRRPAARRSVLAAGVIAVVVVGMGWAFNHHLAAMVYPQGTRSLSGEVDSRLHSEYGVLHVAEMAIGQLWRLVLDSWGVAGIGLFAAVRAAVRRGTRFDLRVMAALSVVVTVAIAVTAPAALPPSQSQTWASGRYLDGMIVAYFLAGIVVLLRAPVRQILAYAAGTAGLAVVTAGVVTVYVGGSVPVGGFGYSFNFAEPAVLTQDWNQASVWLATAVALGLLAVWVGVAVGGRLVAGGGLRCPVVAACVLGLGTGAVSLAAAGDMTSHVARAADSVAVADTSGFVAAAGLKPGQELAVSTGVSWELWIPQEYEVWWSRVLFFTPSSQSPPAAASVVETSWPAGKSAQASWPNAPAGWHVVAASRDGGWVAWRR